MEYNNKIDDIKNNFYNNNQKNIFFKSKQKQRLASNILENINLSDYCDLFIKLNENKITIIYSKLKLIIHPDIYYDLISIINIKINDVLSQYNDFIIDLYVESLTASGMQRLYPLVKCFLNNPIFSSYLDKIKLINMYNVPKTIKNIHVIIWPLVKGTSISKKIKYIN